MVDVGVFGAGVMGTNHVRVLRQLPDVRITYVADPDLSRAHRLATPLGAHATAEPSDVVGQIDTAIVATPTSMHADLAVQLLAGGAHVLVEKPMATTIEDAERIVSAAEQHQRILQVGHVERFNPAVLELDALVNDLVHLEFARISPYSGRSHDGVVGDLMTHDLDLACSLARAEVTDVSAIAQNTRSSTEDLVSALLRFDNGVTAALTASRIGQNKIRTLSLTQRDNYIHVDLLRQDISVTRVEHAEYLSDEGVRYRQAGVIELPFLEHRGEPLYLELRHFFDCVRDGSSPRVTGGDGVRALRLADWVRKAAGVDRPFG